MSIDLTFDLLPVVGVVLALLGFFIPAFSVKYQNMLPEKKQLMYALIVIVAAIVVALLSYFEFLTIYQGVGWRYWVWTPLVDIVIALISMAGTYKAFDKVGDKLPKKLG